MMRRSSFLRRRLFGEAVIVAAALMILGFVAVIEVVLFVLLSYVLEVVAGWVMDCGKCLMSAVEHGDRVVCCSGGKDSSSGMDWTC